MNMSQNLQRDFLVSFLIPTRKEVDNLKTSLDSISENCSGKNTFEIIVMVDEDDFETIDALNAMNFQYPFRLIINERFGYNHLENYYNIAAREARGRWLWIWSGDAYLTCKNWDLILDSYQDQLIVINPYTSNEPWAEYTKDCAIFPIIPYEWYQLTGRVSAWNHIDTYINRIALPLYMLVNDKLLTTFHDKARNSEIVYHEVPFPLEESKIDYQILKKRLGVRSRILYFLKRYPYQKYRNLVRKRRKFVKKLRRYFTDQ
mgnify:CR=1 FL=1